MLRDAESKLTLLAPESSPRVPWVAKIFGPAKPLLSRVGDRQPVQQTLGVPQRQCLRLVVYLPVQWPLPPTRGTTACSSIVAHITKAGACSRCGRILVFYSPECVEKLSEKQVEQHLNRELGGYTEDEMGRKGRSSAVHRTTPRLGRDFSDSFWKAHSRKFVSSNLHRTSSVGLAL